MKLSIIIPVYNEAPFLRRCLDSVKASDDVEIIVVDDGSTDGSSEICDEYLDRFNDIIHIKNGGVSHARNIGLDAAIGEYVAFLDSDDKMADVGIHNMLKVIEQRHEDVIQMNHYRCHDGECRIEGKFYCNKQVYSLDVLPPKWAVVWNKLYKLSFILENKIRFNESQQFDEDRHFNIQCFSHMSGLQCVEEPAVCKYFDNDQSICHTMNKEKLLGATDALVDLLRDDQPPMIQRLIRDCIVRKWTSKRYIEMFGN